MGEGLKAKKNLIVTVFIVVLLLLSVLLYLLHPLAPLFLLASVLVQLPLIWIVSRMTFTKSYQQRWEDRQKAFLKDQNAEEWLQQEEKEAKSTGFQYWSGKGKSKNYLTQADLLLQLKRTADAKEILQLVNTAKLTKQDRNLFLQIESQLENEILKQQKPTE